MRLPCGTTRVLALLLLLQLVKANFRSWVQIGFGAEAEIRQLAGHPTSSSTLMLTDSRGGVFRTDDGGETWYPRWQRLPARLDLQGVSFLNSLGTTILLAATTGLYQSTDSGENWNERKLPMDLSIGEAPPIAFAMRIASSLPGQNSTVYVGTGHSSNTKGRATLPCANNLDLSIYSSSDNGGTWRRYPLSPYPNSPFRCSSIEHLVMDPLNPAALYVSTSRGRNQYDHTGIQYPIFTYSDDYSSTWSHWTGAKVSTSSYYIDEFLVRGYGGRVSAMSFTSDGLTLAVAFENGQLKLGCRQSYGAPWSVSDLMSSSANSYIQSLVIFTQSNALGGRTDSIYTGTEQTTGTEESGLQLASLNVTYAGLNATHAGSMSVNSISWTALANAWDADTSGWDASPWNISAIVFGKGSTDSAGITPTMWLVDTHRIYSTGSPYTTWSARYSSRATKAKGWTGHGSDSHEFTYILSETNNHAELLFGSATEVLYTSADGGDSLLSAKNLIEQASQLGSGPTTFKYSRAAFEIDTSPKMFLIHCASNVSYPGRADSRLFLKRHSQYIMLSNLTSLLEGNVSMTKSNTARAVILAIGSRVYELSGFQRIADRLTLDLDVVELGHNRPLPNIEAKEWNATLNSSQWHNYSIAVSNPDNFGADCSQEIDIAYCDTCTGSATQYILLCDEGVYQYSSVTTTSTNFLGYMRYMHWTTPKHHTYWVNGLDSGVNYADLMATRTAWKAFDDDEKFGWRNGGEQYTLYDGFKQVFRVESASPSVSSTMIIISNSYIYAQISGADWVTVCSARDVMRQTGWGGINVNFTTATYLPDSTAGYKLVVATRHQNQDWGEKNNQQASKVLIITPILTGSAAAKDLDYTISIVDETEDLGPAAITSFFTAANEYFYATTAAHGAWTWHKKNLVSSSTDPTSWTPHVLGEVGAFGNKSIQVSSTVTSSIISSSFLTMYRVDTWLRGDCKIRIIPNSLLTEDHLITTVSSVTPGSWSPIHLEISLPSASSSFTLRFENTGSECYSDRTWLGPASNDVNANDALRSRPRLTGSETLATAAVPVLISTTSAEISFSWSAPALSSWNEERSGYKIEWRLKTDNDAGVYSSKDVAASASSSTIPCSLELVRTTGASYQIRVSSKGVVGDSEPSNPLLATCQAVVAGAPGSPVLVNQPRSREVMLSWTIPEYDGTFRVIGYKVYFNGASWPDSVNPFVFDTNEGTITGLNAGTSYEFTAVALNAVGDSIASDPSPTIEMASAAAGLCNITMRLTESKTILKNYPFGTGSEANWNELFKLDLAHTVGANANRVSDVQVWQKNVVKISGTGLRLDAIETYVTFWLKSGYLASEPSLVDCQAALVSALVAADSKLYKGITTHAVDSRYLLYDGADPGIYEARQAMGGSSSRLNEQTMQMIGLTLFIAIPLLVNFKTFVADWFASRASGNAYREKYDQ